LLLRLFLIVDRDNIGIGLLLAALSSLSSVFSDLFLPLLLLLSFLLELFLLDKFVFHLLSLLLPLVPH
jgi:hypothetical protein